MIYTVRHGKIEKEFKNYRKALRDAVSQCSMNFPSYLIINGTVKQTFIVKEDGLVHEQF